MTSGCRGEPARGCVKALRNPGATTPSRSSGMTRGRPRRSRRLPSMPVTWNAIGLDGSGVTADRPGTLNVARASVLRVAVRRTSLQPRAPGTAERRGLVDGVIVALLFHGALRGEVAAPRRVMSKPMER